MTKNQSKSWLDRNWGWVALAGLIGIAVNLYIIHAIK